MAKKSKKQQPGGTPATVALTSAGVEFTVHAYEHDPSHPSYGEEAAEAMGVSPDRVFKTLVADVDGELTVAVVPVAGSLDLKALATAVGGKRAAMADPSPRSGPAGMSVGASPPSGSARGSYGSGRVGRGPRHDLCVGGPAGAGGGARPGGPGEADGSGAGSCRTCVTPRRGPDSRLSTEGMSKKTRKRKWRAKKGRSNHGRRPA